MSRPKPVKEWTPRDVETVTHIAENNLIWLQKQLSGELPRHARRSSATLLKVARTIRLRVEKIEKYVKLNHEAGTI